MSKLIRSTINWVGSKNLGAWTSTTYFSCIQSYVFVSLFSAPLSVEFAWNNNNYFEMIFLQRRQRGNYSKFQNHREILWHERDNFYLQPVPSLNTFSCAWSVYRRWLSCCALLSKNRPVHLYTWDFLAFNIAGKFYYYDHSYTISLLLRRRHIRYNGTDIWVLPQHSQSLGWKQVEGVFRRLRGENGKTWQHCSTSFQ